MTSRPPARCCSTGIRAEAPFASPAGSPSFESQIRSSGKRIVNVCTERQRGSRSATFAGYLDKYLGPVR